MGTLVAKQPSRDLAMRVCDALINYLPGARLWDLANLLTPVYQGLAYGVVNCSQAKVLAGDLLVWIQKVPVTHVFDYEGIISVLSEIVIRHPEAIEDPPAFLVVLRKDLEEMVDRSRRDLNEDLSMLNHRLIGECVALMLALHATYTFELQVRILKTALAFVTELWRGPAKPVMPPDAWTSIRWSLERMLDRPDEFAAFEEDIKRALRVFSTNPPS
jgi:hypothetical protein